MSNRLFNLIKKNEIFFLLENTLAPENSQSSYLFSNPTEEIIAFNQEDLFKSLKKIEEERLKGRYLAGYISYEAGYFLIDKFNGNPKSNSSYPLLHFFCFEEPILLSKNQISINLQELNFDYPNIYNLTFREQEKSYINKIKHIKKYIESGDTYQINYTTSLSFNLYGSIYSLYLELRKRQQVNYSALINLGDKKILSLSPELFLKKEGDKIISKPMKGTAQRSDNLEEDQKIINFLKNDSKSLSENMMIVDLMRNDIGKIAHLESIKVTNLFEIESYKTLHQMISTVESKIDKETSFIKIIKNLFPGGSITGAPKIRTMEIINELESSPRGIYTGAIGYIKPSNDFCFNISIRTIIYDDKTNKGNLGIGSGIVYESLPQEEWKESLLKSKFLTGINNNFQLIETFSYLPQKKHLGNFKEHMNRLCSSAKFWGFNFDYKKIENQLQDYISNLGNLKEDEIFKIRLLLNQPGELSIQHEKIIKNQQEPYNIYISDRNIDSLSIFRRHKTTYRKIYEEEFLKAQEQGMYDAIFLNKKGEIAEASRHNIFIEKKGIFYTPPISSGALPGVMRKKILNDKRMVSKVRVLYLDDLQKADNIYLSNSIRGLVKVNLM
jgi:para-aminobenzoate synthetase/4-amino-4-deoxychorismate lyase